MTDDASTVGEQPGSPTVELRHITKRFGPVTACADISLSLQAGQIHGILGENGAGKSTLMKMLIGLIHPDDGEIHRGGKRVVVRDPQTAADLGIGMVHQHLSLVDALTVWENVLLGDSHHFDRGAARDSVAATGARYGIAVDPDSVVGELSAGMRQRVELIKCLRRDPAMLILDEPTSVLTPAESHELFTVLRDGIAAEGRAVALVSHKLAEVLHATDVVTILRNGRVIEQLPTASATALGLATAMVGRRVSLRSSAAALGATDEIDVAMEPPGGDTDGVAKRVTKPAGQVPALRIEGARYSRRGVVLLDGLSLSVCPGEIVGVAGVEGNGQRHLADLLSSLIHLDAGTVEVDGVHAQPGRAGHMGQLGVAVIPEDRHDSGCVVTMSVAENLLLDRMATVSSAGFIRRRELRERALRLIDEFGIRSAGPDVPLASLSGGNQQRVILARELSHHPKVLVAAQPTRGLDVGAIEYVSQRLADAAERGIGVLLISTELEEILTLSHRIVVISRGRIIGEMPRAEASTERLGLLMGGVAVDG